MPDETLVLGVCRTVLAELREVLDCDSLWIITPLGKGFFEELMTALEDVYLFVINKLESK